MSTAKPQKPTVDPFASAVAAKAMKEGSKAADQATLDSNAQAVQRYQQYQQARAANPFMAAALRAEHSAQIEHGRELTKTAAAARPELAVIPSPTSAAQQVADRMAFDTHAALAQSNPFRASAFRLANSDAIARGAKVEIPEQAPQPSPPNPPPDDPPPQAA